MSLHDFVTSRYPDLRRSAFLMCGDWGPAGELARATLARFADECRHGPVEDPDAFVYADLMESLRGRPRRRERVFAAPGTAGSGMGGGDPVRTILLLDALRRLSSRCRAVLVLRRWTGFAVDETADVLGLTDERVARYEAAGLAALGTLLGPAAPPLEELLAGAVAGEPPIAGDVEAVFRRAGALRRRRLRNLVAAGAAVVVLVAAAGYGLTTALVPETVRPASAADGPAPPPDPVLAAVRRAGAPAGLRVVPREPARGDGWRQYTAVDRRSGRPRGLIEVSVYEAPGRLCFPVRADPRACARPETAGGVQHVRYADDRDVDWQVVQVIARRVADGRVVALMATGERGTGSARAGRPPLTALQAATLAADPRLMDAFDPRERCTGADPACPLLAVPLPAGA